MCALVCFLGISRPHEVNSQDKLSWEYSALLQKFCKIMNVVIVLHIQMLQGTITSAFNFTFNF